MAHMLMEPSYLRDMLSCFDQGEKLVLFVALFLFEKSGKSTRQNDMITEIFTEPDQEKEGERDRGSASFNLHDITLTSLEFKMERSYLVYS
jgi:hypothetical protein